MMNRKLILLLSASAHLPSGSSDADFEALYQKEIKPLVQALDKFPGINMTFHYSGVILYWIERRHPELFMLLEDLLSRKQAELLGGGFYNPMLCLLPAADKIGQIEMLTTYLRKHFGKRPQGCWLPAMAWEQNLVGPLNSCGMNYTFLDDGQFYGAGVKPCEGGIFRPCITEDQGKLITVFPVANTLRGQLRKGSPGRVLGDLAEKLPQGEYPVMVFPFGGEAEGNGFSEQEYEKFFLDLSGTDSSVEFSTPARVFRNLRELKKVYFPGVCAGNGIHPRQFLADHPEAGGIYAKMMYVRSLINNRLRGDKARKRIALEELWKAQDSGIYSPGSAAVPGFFNSPVRKAAYRSILEAEMITREKGRFAASLSVFDFDLDGEGEYVFQDDKFNCCIKSRGAGIFELDYLPCAWNYLDTLAPHEGSRDLRGNERRCAFADWLLPASRTIDDIIPDGTPGGRFCGDEEYTVVETDRVRRCQSFALAPKPGLPFGEIGIEKNWQLKKNSLVLEYVLGNTGDTLVNFIFCPSIDLSFPGEGGNYLRVLAQREGVKESVTAENAVTVPNIRGLEFQDIVNEAIITLELNRVFDAKIRNIYAGISGREEYQSTCVMPFIPVSLEGGKSWKAVFTLRISS